MTMNASPSNPPVSSQPSPQTSHIQQTNMTTQKDHLLLIFQHEQNNSFTLINDPGLPISPNSGSPFSDGGSRAGSGLLMTMNQNPRLLAAVTARMGRNQGVYRGLYVPFSFLF